MDFNTILIVLCITLSLIGFGIIGLWLFELGKIRAIEQFHDIYGRNSKISLDGDGYVLRYYVKGILKTISANNMNELYLNIAKTIKSEHDADMEVIVKCRVFDEVNKFYKDSGKVQIELK